MRDEQNNKTKAWQYYEMGRAYNNRLVPNQYNLVNTNIEFFAGNQWMHLPDTPAMAGLMKPTFNIIKRITNTFVSSLASSKTTILFQPLSYYSGGVDPENQDSDPSVIATAEVRNLFEKFKMDYRIRDALFDGAQTGDYCAHFYWNPDAIPYGGAFGPHRGEIEMELVDGINVMFGNPNVCNVEDQPYILVIGRDTVDHLKEEALHYKKSKTKRGGKAPTDMDIESIAPDMEYQRQSGIGGRTELTTSDDRSGKALYILLYTKVTTEEKLIDEETGLPKQEPVLDSKGEKIQEKDKQGNLLFDMEGKPLYKTQDAKVYKTTVHVTKATRTVNIYEDVDTGLSRYPIAWGNWERQKNQYHGRALVTGIVPNQIFINSMMAMVFRHLQLMAFPVRLYNADLLSQLSNEIGQAIGVRNLQPGQDLRAAMTVIQPADMSNQIVLAIDKVMQYTKECLGASDVQMGNVHPENTSALMVLQSSSEVPLENTRACLHEWIEDIGSILLDMIGTYYGERPMVRDREFRDFMTGTDGSPMIDPTTGQMMMQTVQRRVMQDYDFSQFKHLYFNVNIDVGASTYWSEISMVQTLDNLRRDGTLDVIDYLERIPDKLIPRKDELIRKMKQSMANVAQQQSAAGMIPEMPGQQGEQMPKDQTKVARKASKGAPAMGGMLDADKSVANLPSSVQAQFNQLPNKAKKALINKESLHG